MADYLMAGESPFLKSIRLEGKNIKLPLSPINLNIECKVDTHKNESVHSTKN